MRRTEISFNNSVAITFSISSFTLLAERDRSSLFYVHFAAAHTNAYGPRFKSTVGPAN